MDKRYKNCTEFQLAVYKIVATIPKGETRSYKWVAERLGKPNAARAVGQALKANPTYKIIPCHRVVRSDGSIGGFAWGTKRKQVLLRRESNANSTKSSKN